MTKKVSDYRHPVKFYKPSDEFEVEPSGNLVPIFEFYKTIRCKKEDIIRENLESLISGANHVKKRTRLTLRYREDITEDMQFEIGKHMYSIKIVGDSKGDRKEIQVIGEAIADGGV